MSPEIAPTWLKLTGKIWRGSFHTVSTGKRLIGLPIADVQLENPRAVGEGRLLTPLLPFATGRLWAVESTSIVEDPRRTDSERCRTLEDPVSRQAADDVRRNPAQPPRRGQVRTGPQTGA